MLQLVVSQSSAGLKPPSMDSINSIVSAYIEGPFSFFAHFACSVCGPMYSVVIGDLASYLMLCNCGMYALLLFGDRHCECELLIVLGDWVVNPQ